MAVKKKTTPKTMSHYDYSKKKMWIGVLLFLAGLILYMGYDWAMVFMVIGLLMFVKSLLMKAK